MEDSSKDLEESLFSNFKCLTVRDHETGETLCVKRDVETGETTSLPWAAISAQKKTGFRIPFAILKREVPVEDCDRTVKAKSVTALRDETSSACVSASASPEVLTASDILVAQVPGSKLSSLFCRKRKTVAEPDARVIAKPGREGLLRAIQLFLVALSLVSPGFFFPAVFLIKLMCHYREHQQNWDLDVGYQPDHSTCFLTRQVCRVCRERTNTERMLKVHSSMGVVDKLKGKTTENDTCRRIQDCGFCD